MNPQKNPKFITPEFIAGREDPHKTFEYLDPTPIAPPIGYRAQPSLIEQVRSMVRTVVSERAEAQGHESFDEGDDFDVGDDYDPTSPYEYDFEPPAMPAKPVADAPKPPDPVPPPDGPNPTPAPLSPGGKPPTA